MVARRVCRDPFLKLGGRQRQGGVHGPTGLKSPYFLEILGFKVDLGLGKLVDTMAGQYGCSVNVRLDPFVGSDDVFFAGD